MDEATILEIQAWLLKAQHDLESAEWLLARAIPLCSAASFHSQQAGEKVLKAYLTWRNEPLERTHSLVALIARCLPFDASFDTLRYAATTLTPYAVASRYPGDLPDLTEGEAQEALTLALEIWEFVLSRLPPEVHLTD